MSKCSAKVYNSFGPGHRWPCSYQAKVQREGKGYCGIHDPVKKAARDAERHTRWAAEFRARVKDDTDHRRKLRSHDGLVAACELALESEECVCGGNKGAPGMHCILTAALKAAKG